MLKQTATFLLRARMRSCTERDIDITSLSVCLSVTRSYCLNG